GIHRFRPELARRHHRVRDVVVIGPGDGIADLQLQLDRSEGEIVDRHRDGLGMCAGVGRDEERRSDGEACAEAAEGIERHFQIPLKPCLQPCSGVSMIASGSLPILKLMLAMPSTLRSFESSTFIGPGEGAVPGAGCGNAVERAVWKVTLPSTFCITWWIWPLSTVTEPNPFRYSSARAPSSVPQPHCG